MIIFWIPWFWISTNWIENPWFTQNHLNCTKQFPPSVMEICKSQCRNKSTYLFFSIHPLNKNLIFVQPLNLRATFRLIDENLSSGCVTVECFSLHCWPSLKLFRPFGYFIFVRIFEITMPWHSMNESELKSGQGDEITLLYRKMLMKGRGKIWNKRQRVYSDHH